MSTMRSRSRPRRPVGVRLLALMMVFQALSVSSTIHVERAWFQFEVPVPFDGEALRRLLAGPAAGVAGVIIAVGLWQLYRWAWYATMLWVGTSLALALRAYLNGDPPYAVMFVSVLTVFYLNHSDVQRAFGGGTEPTGAQP